MVVPSAAQLQAFAGGQMTDLPEFDEVSFDGTELVEIVAPGNEAEGINYSITTALLAALLAQLSASGIIITNGEYSDPGDPYIPPASVARIYVNKTVAGPTYIEFGAASGYVVEPLVKDVAGTVDVGSEITVTFNGAEAADGNTTVAIGSPYGGYFFRPLSSLAKWTLGSA